MVVPTVWTPASITRLSVFVSDMHAVSGPPDLIALCIVASVLYVWRGKKAWYMESMDPPGALPLTATLVKAGPLLNLSFPI